MNSVAVQPVHPIGMAARHKPDILGDGRHLLFSDRHPFAGGSEHCAAYLGDDDGYEVKLVGE